MKKKVLFFIHDLGQGGAEKVLVNLVNNLDREKFDIEVLAMFGGGINEKCLKADITYKPVFKRVFPGNSKIMKLFSPGLLHKLFIKDKYDIEVSYLEGPCARIISGCPHPETKLVSWIHTKFKSSQDIYSHFRNKGEADRCYKRFDYTAFVSKDVGSNFLKTIHLNNPNGVLYNTIESDQILSLSKEPVDLTFKQDTVNIITVGTLKEVKGYDRLLQITKRLKENGYIFNLFFLGSGPLEQKMKQYVADNNLNDCVTFLGFHSNPYKYVAKCDLFVCSSYTEGFSTAATEALIVGTPVCTVDVSGMKELLGDNNEYGLVTENTEDALFKGIKDYLDNPKLLKQYRDKALERSKLFSISKTTSEVEKMLSGLCN